MASPVSPTYVRMCSSGVAFEEDRLMIEIEERCLLIRVIETNSPIVFGTGLGP